MQNDGSVKDYRISPNGRCHLPLDCTDSVQLLEIWEHFEDRNWPLQVAIVNDFAVEWVPVHDKLLERRKACQLMHFLASKGRAHDQKR